MDCTPVDVYDDPSLKPMCKLAPGSCDTLWLDAGLGDKRQHAPDVCDWTELPLHALHHAGAPALVLHSLARSRNPLSCSRCSILAFELLCTASAESYLKGEGGCLSWVSAQYGIMLFFAAWCLIMTLYIILCLPETKGVPIEEIVVVWRKHWLWKRFVQPAAIDMNGGEGLLQEHLPLRSRWNNLELLQVCKFSSIGYLLCTGLPPQAGKHSHQEDIGLWVLSQS